METITRDTDRDFFMSPQEAIEVTAAARVGPCVGVVGRVAGCPWRWQGGTCECLAVWPRKPSPPPQLHTPTVLHPTPQYGLIDAIIAKPQLYEARGAAVTA